METSKEELQSLNEESVTVNSELQGRIDELVTANDDMKNLLDATEIATIFLDINLNVRRFTRKATELIPLTKSDIGRPISHFSTILQDFMVTEYAANVLQNLDKREVEVQDGEGHVYRVLIRPYRTINNVIDGVVIIFDDITQFKQLLQSKRLAAVVEDSIDAITLHDLTGNIRAWNRGAEKMYGYSEEEALQMNILDMVPPERKNATETLLTRLQKEEEKAQSLVVERFAKDGTLINVWLTATVLKDETGRPEYIAITERDLQQLNKDSLKLLTGEHHVTR